MQSIRELLTRLVAAHPGAFGILIVYTLLWLIFDRGRADRNRHGPGRTIARA
jgi:hypothetical protein